MVTIYKRWLQFLKIYYIGYNFIWVSYAGKKNCNYKCLNYLYSQFFN